MPAARVGPASEEAPSTSPPPPSPGRHTVVTPGTPGPDPRARAGSPAPHRARHPRQAAALIALVGILLTAAAALAAFRIDQNTEERLLDRQTRQAASVISSALTTIEQPLAATLALRRAEGDAASPATFAAYMATHVGPDRVYQTASLWQRRGDDLRLVRTVGTAPTMSPDDPATIAQLRRAFSSATTTVRFVPVGRRTQIIYVKADAETGSLVYVERSIPENRRTEFDRDSAFRELHYAIYFGARTSDKALAATDVDPATLPLEGTTGRTEVPFGDEVFTLTTDARQHLGSELSEQLPWMLLLSGLLLTALATRAGHQLARGRQTAENDAVTITGLYERTESLYAQQRELFVSLQRALLPHLNPTIPGVEFATEYVAGAHGLDIGGDWFSLIALDENRFGFVVGDVSGRGVDAVAVMAHARFTIRAYLIDGDDPAVALEKCAPQFDIATDGHMTTVLAGVGDSRTGEVRLASAGHPPPLLLTTSGASFVDVAPGRPLGTGTGSYPTTTVRMPVGSTLFCYTDGLIERRGEDIDAGFDRLAAVLSTVATQPAEELVAHALASLRDEDTADDIATLAIRWTGA